MNNNTIKPNKPDNGEPLPEFILNTLRLCAACGTPATFNGGQISYQTTTANFKLINLADFKRLQTTIKAITTATGGKPTEPKPGADFAIIYKNDKSNKKYFKFEKCGNIQPLLKPGDVFFGYDVKTNSAIIKNITDVKSIFIGGSSGGGKSSLINSIIFSLIISGGCYFDMIDLKKVELSLYNNKLKNKKYITATTKAEAVAMLRRIKEEILSRYEAMQAEGTRKADIKEYPPHILFIDEYATLEAVEGSEIESLISFIAATGRACNYFIVAATQHATNQTFTTKARANFQSRIALRCMTVQQSTNIIGTRNAVDLCGAGDALAHFDGCADLIRFQAPLFDDDTAAALFLK